MEGDLGQKLKKIEEALYGSGNPVPLEKKDLISVLLTFPACLVAAADGVVDVDERLYLMNISESLGEEDNSNSNKARLNTAERYRAFMWFLNNKTSSEDMIFSLIREYIGEIQILQQQLSEMMWGMAEASDGVSESEKTEIKRISDELGITKNLN